ncbi:MAG TPA: hypothetical protein PKL97_06590 [Candidatus Omnitrophota bacterium]|nr:hypothetical protein [Candidatus Omnitrophota bacterium]
MNRTYPLSLFFLVLLAGCITATNRYLSDPELQEASFRLAEDYLEGQKAEESETVADEKYGTGAINLDDVEDYHCDTYGKRFENPAVGCRVQYEDKTGQMSWDDFTISFSYSKKLRDLKEKYLGLRIKAVTREKLAG